MKFVHKKSAYCRVNLVSFVDEKHINHFRAETHTVAIITSLANILTDADKKNLEQFARDNVSRLSNGPIIINLTEVPA